MTQDEAKQVVAAIDAGRDVWVVFEDGEDGALLGWSVGGESLLRHLRPEIRHTHHTNTPQDVDDLRSFARKGEPDGITALGWAQVWVAL